MTIDVVRILLAEYAVLGTDRQAWSYGPLAVDEHIPVDRAVFIEPLETIEQNNELVRLLDDEQAEIHKVVVGPFDDPDAFFAASRALGLITSAVRATDAPPGICTTTKNAP